MAGTDRRRDVCDVGDSVGEITSITPSGNTVDPYFINTNELQTGNSIVKKMLVGRENYSSWKVAMEIALSARSQLGFVRGEYPKTTDPGLLTKWQRCNDIVMSWLICSMSENVGERILRCKNVMTAWNILKVRYSGSNVVRKSVLLTKISNCVQGDLSIEAYFDQLNKYWEEYDSIRRNGSCPQNGACTCCGSMNEEEEKIE